MYFQTDTKMEMEPNATSTGISLLRMPRREALVTTAKETALPTRWMPGRDGRATRVATPSSRLSPPALRACMRS
jgi:hypothetical protein